MLDLLPEYVVTEEVLAGLGLTDGGTARLAFADGRLAVLEPVAASSFASIGSILAPLMRPAANGFPALAPLPRATSGSRDSIEARTVPGTTRPPRRP